MLHDVSRAGQANTERDGPYGRASGTVLRQDLSSNDPVASLKELEVLISRLRPVDHTTVNYAVYQALVLDRDWSRPFLLGLHSHE